MSQILFESGIPLMILRPTNVVYRFISADDQRIWVANKVLLMANPSPSILVVGGRITFSDPSPKAWQNFLKIFEFLAKSSKTKSVILEFELPEIKRGFLDAVPQDYLEKKYKVRILEGRVDVPIKIAAEILGQARGFDVGARVGPLELIFSHTSKLDVLTELQFASGISTLLQKMFPKAKVK